MSRRHNEFIKLCFWQHLYELIIVKIQFYWLIVSFYEEKWTWIDFSQGPGVIIKKEVLEHPVSRVRLEQLELDVDLLLFAFRNLILLFFFFFNYWNIISFLIVSFDYQKLDFTFLA